MPIPNAPLLPQTRWPVVIGVVCIVFGSIGVLSSPMQFLSPIFTKMSFQMYIQQGTVTEEQVDDFINKWRGFQLIFGLAFGFVSICMLLGGIFLAKRKKKGARVLQIWSVLFILYALTVPFFTSGMMTDQMALQMTAQSGDLDMEQFQTMMGIFVKVIMVVSVVFWIALPIFLLIWFKRSKIKNEMQTWDA